MNERARLLQLEAIDEVLDDLIHIMKNDADEYERLNKTDELPPIYENLPIHLAPNVIKYVASIKDKVEKERATKRTSFRPQQIQPLANELTDLVKLIMKTLNKGPSVLLPQHPLKDSYDYTYQTSIMAESFSSSLINKMYDYMNVTCVEFAKYIQILNDLKLENYSQEILVKVEHDKFYDSHLHLNNNNYFIDPHSFDVTDDYLKSFCDVFQNNTRIKALKITSMSLTDACAPYLITCLQKLNSLTLETPQLSNKGAQMLADGPAISTLTINSMELTDEAMEYFGRKTGLTKFSLICPKITLSGVLHLLENKEITQLKISTDNITDADLITIVEKLKETNVTSLEITSNRITNTGLKTLSSALSLQELTICSNQVTVEAVESFNQHAKLTKLELYGDRLEKQEGMQFFATNLPSSHPHAKAYKTFLLALSPKEFKQKIISSQSITDFVLQDSELCSRLNDLPGPANQQTFERSCTARSILLVLNKLGLYEDEAMTKTNELKIYSKIWEAPGNEADMALIIQFLQGLNINCIVHEDTKKISDLLQTHPQFKHRHESFTNLKKQLTSRSASIYETSWPDHTSLMLVVAGSTGLHMVLVAYENNKYYFFDPGDGSRTENVSLENLINDSNYLFTGIVIQMQSANLTATCKSGFFKHQEDPNSSPSVEDNPGCSIQ